MDFTKIGIREQVIVLSASDLEQAFRNILEEMLSQWEDEKRKEEKLITKAEARRRLGVNPSTLWRWDREGYLKARHKGRKVFYLESDVDELGR